MKVAKNSDFFSAFCKDKSVTKIKSLSRDFIAKNCRARRKLADFSELNFHCERASTYLAAIRNEVSSVRNEVSCASVEVC